MQAIALQYLLEKFYDEVKQNEKKYAKLYKIQQIFRNHSENMTLEDYNKVCVLLNHTDLTANEIEKEVWG
jgi:hypothetical protein